MGLIRNFAVSQRQNARMETDKMVNEEKVILMTKASVYEERLGKKDLQIVRYFRHDYISVNLLHGWFFSTICFALGLVLWGACRMEYLMNNLHKMDIKSFGLTVALLYILTVAVYSCVLYGICSYRYSMAKKSVGGYAHILKKLSDLYEQEESAPGPERRTEEMKNDSIT